MLTKGMLAAYLARIGVPGPLVLDAAALRGLHQAHLEAVPFENLSIHLGEPISLDEADLTCWWQQTSPQSHFTRSVICSRLTQDGRISISERKLIRTAAGQRTEENLPDDQAVLAAYRDHFGIDLSTVPEPAASRAQ
jgi:arylamine N-acetyltransferase